MRWLLFLCCSSVLVLAAPGAMGDEIPFNSYAAAGGFLPQTPSVTGGSPGAFFNPAAWATSQRADLGFYWSNLDVRPNSLDQWGVSAGHNVGFSAQTYTDPVSGGRFQDFQLGVAAGDESAAFGASWRWLGGDRELAGRSNGLQLGVVDRPSRHVTWGFSMLIDSFISPAGGILDLGLRPLGSPLLTIYGDLSASRGQRASDFPWGVGAEIRPVTGTHLGVTFRDDPEDDFTFALNLGVTLDNLGVHVLPQYAKDGDHRQTSSLIHIVPPHKGIPVARAVRESQGPSRIVPLSLEGKFVTYQTPRYFNETTVAWKDLAATLDRILEEPSAAGVVLNLSGTRIRPSLAWELRGKLSALRQAGKSVYIHGDRMRMGLYYVASVADRLTLDPQGSLLLPGLSAHRTYMKSFLEKIGVGSEELRYFSHKTAMQGYVRKDMSEADREQYTRMIDVIYELWRDGIVRGRDIDETEFDSVVDNDVYVFANLAVERSLIDGTGRWSDLTTWINGQKRHTVAGLPGDPERRPHPDEHWGSPPEIAVVYLVGACDMDRGIRGRATAKFLNRQLRNRNLKGVVLRVDSPGGDPMASDIVADAVRKLQGRGIPVVVSQGDVAASGGYWLSMDADTVLTTPLSITGSIGVIAGWFWDDGLGDKIGFSSDGVQRGKHADVFAGIRFPFVGGRLPSRPLSDEERGLAERRIRQSYDSFVAGVAAGRGMSEERVRELGEGRVWMGGDAVDNGLADGLGGLDTAVNWVVTKANLEHRDDVRFVEFPESPLFQWPRLGPSMPGLFGILDRDKQEPLLDGNEPESYETVYLGILAGAPGNPMLLVPPAALPEGWDEMR